MVVGLLNPLAVQADHPLIRVCLLAHLLVFKVPLLLA
jgi:hypothetical protein